MPLYPAAGSSVAKRMKSSGFLAVGDPELAAVQDVLAAFECGARLQGKRVGTGSGFAEGIGAHGFSAPFRADSVSSAPQCPNAGGHC